MRDIDILKDILQEITNLCKENRVLRKANKALKRSVSIQNIPPHNSKRIAMIKAICEEFGVDYFTFSNIPDPEFNFNEPYQKATSLRVLDILVSAGLVDPQEPCDIEFLYCIVKKLELIGVEVI